MPRKPRVFISYAHDSETHRSKALTLANELRRDGVEAYLDQYYENDSIDWPRWMLREIKQADFVLCVASPLYGKRVEGDEELGRGRGAKWEGAIITQLLYESEGTDRKFIPVALSREDEPHIPLILRPTTRFLVEDEHGYLKLLRRITEQPRIVMPPVGELRVLATEVTEAPGNPFAGPMPLPDTQQVARGASPAVAPRRSDRADRVFELAETGRSRLFGERLTLLDPDEQTYVIKRLIDAPLSTHLAEAVGAMAEAPPPVIRLSSLLSRLMTSAVLSDDVSVIVAVLTSWSEDVLSQADGGAREAFFREVIRIMMADQYSDVNRVTPAITSVHSAIPASLHVEYLGALFDQARSGAFQGRPAALTALATLPEALARAALDFLDEEILLWRVDEAVATQLLENHRDLWPEDKVALFSEYVEEGHAAFLYVRFHQSEDE